MPTTQMNVWSGSFGKEYTDRNKRTLEGRDARCKELIGVTRTELNRRFLDGLDRSLRILEVGCNIGHQLLFLQKMGFHNLFGVELQEYAARESKRIGIDLNVAVASGHDLPFHDHSFDMVFTSVFLIHISPNDINSVLKEIVRTSNKYILGYEYYAPKMVEIHYRGHDNLLWKGNYREMFQKIDPELGLVMEEQYPYNHGNSIDNMFLLQREII